MDAPSKISAPARDRMASTDSVEQEINSPTQRALEQARSKSASDAASKYLAGIMPFGVNYYETHTSPSQRRSSSTAFSPVRASPAIASSPIALTEKPQPLILDKSSNPKTRRIPLGCLTDFELRHLGYYYPRGGTEGVNSRINILDGKEGDAVTICLKIQKAAESSDAKDFTQEIQLDFLKEVIKIAKKKMAADKRPAPAISKQEASQSDEKDFTQEARPEAIKVESKEMAADKRPAPAISKQEASQLELLIAKQKSGTIKHFGR